MSPAIAPDDQKPPATIFQHPLAPVQFDRDSVMRAKHAARLERVEFLATILARYDDVTLHAAPTVVRAHYMNAARMAMSAAQKVSW